MTRPAQRITIDSSVYSRQTLLKDSFKRVSDLLEKNRVKTVLDVGCACGDFVRFLPASITRAVGVDISQDMIQEAKRRSAGRRDQFLCLDILAEGAERRVGGPFEAITALGTLHTFLDVEPFLNKLISLKPRIIVIHSPFNDDPVDTQHFHRDLSREETTFQCVYSIFSKISVENYLKKKKISSFKFIPFEMEKDIPKDPRLPTRNYHIRLDSGERFLTNGLGILFKEYMLVIKMA